MSKFYRVQRGEAGHSSTRCFDGSDRFTNSDPHLKPATIVSLRDCLRIMGIPDDSEATIQVTWGRGKEL